MPVPASASVPAGQTLLLLQQALSPPQGPRPGTSSPPMAPGSLGAQPTSLPRVPTSWHTEGSHGGLRPRPALLLALGLCFEVQQSLCPLGGRQSCWAGRGGAGEGPQARGELPNPPSQTKEGGVS